MIRCLRRILAATAFLLGLGGIQLCAQIVTWTGLGNDEWTDNPANWAGGNLPVNDGSETFVFGPASQYYLLFGDSLNAYKVSIVGNPASYQIDDDEYDLNLGAGGLVYAPSGAISSTIGSYPVNVLTDQTWDIQGGELHIEYEIEGIGRINKTGAGTLALESNGNYWTGGLTLSDGKLGIPGSSYTSSALGTGDLIFNGGTLAASDRYSYYGYESGDPLTLDNPIFSNGTIKTENDLEVHFQGPAVLNADTTIESKGESLFFEGDISEAGGSRKLTIDSTNLVALLGNSSYTGGTEVINGRLIFAVWDAIPSNHLDSSSVGHLTAGLNGYIGYGDDQITGSSQIDFIDDFNKSATLGTVGFDTDPDFSSPTEFTGDIDLTGFGASATLGSATQAILSGNITPQGADYRFGGGGGFLQVDSQLTDQTSPTAAPRGLVVDSPVGLPLTLKLTNASNNYSGGTSVTQSALIFGSGYPATFPGGTGSITINTGGYVGFESWGDQSEDQFVNNSLDLIATSSVGAVGFENVYSVSAPIDLSAFTNGLYLGTATTGGTDDGLSGGTTLSGTITPAGGASAPYRFAGYKGGLLIVESPLSGAAGVVIGDPSSPGTFGDVVQKEYSKVALTGDNSAMTGDVTFYGGELFVGQGAGTPGVDPVTSLGTGNLIIPGMTLPAWWSDSDGTPPSPLLSSDDAVIANNVTLNTRLELADSQDFTFTGQVTGTGSFYLNSYACLMLNNSANTFSGGIYLSSGSRLDVYDDLAAGLGKIGFGYSGGTAYFYTNNPVIHGIESNAYGAQLELLSSTSPRMTIIQDFDSIYTGALRADSGGAGVDGVFIKAGTGTLTLSDASIYGYGQGATNDILEIQGGKVVLSNTYFENTNTAVKLNGGALQISAGTSFTNPIIFGASGGKLNGNYTFTTAQTLGAGVSLAPGNSPGTMTFASGLTVTNGLETDIEINASADNPGISSDLLVVNGPGLDLSAVSAGGYTLKIISLSLLGGNAAGPVDDLGLSASWTIFQTTALTGYVAGGSQFTLDASAFVTLGTFALTQSGNDLVLNFTAVPEPSTWALLMLGLAGGGLAHWRRSRRS